MRSGAEHEQRGNYIFARPPFVASRKLKIFSLALEFTHQCVPYSTVRGMPFFNVSSFYDRYPIRIIITINQHFCRSRWRFFSVLMFVIVVGPLFSSSVRDEKIHYYFNDAQMKSKDQHQKFIAKWS